MSWFDAPPNYPTRPRDYSLDMWLLFIYVFTLLLLAPLAGPGFTIRQDLLLASVLGAILMAISVAYRVHMHWRWFGIQRGQTSRTIFRVFSLALVIVALSPAAPFDDPRFLPIYLAPAGIVLFDVLFLFGMTETSKTQFLQHCIAETSTETAQRSNYSQPTPAPQPSRWENLARILYRTVYLIMCVIWVARLDLVAIAHRHGALQPTADQPAPVQLDGHAVYLAHYQQILLDHLPRIGIGFLMLLLLVGYLLNYFAGLNLFPNMRSREQLRRDDQDDQPRLNLSNAPSSK
jgi:hypothetical protein